MADTFEKKLGELSGGKFKIRQFPNAALGSEPETAQKVRAGDIDFVINATANTSSVVPQSGVFSLHFIFRDEAHLEKAMNDKGINDAFKAMIAENVQGARSLDSSPRASGTCIQAHDPERLRYRRQEGARPGDEDGGCLLHGLQGRAHPHALRPGLHLAPDRAHRHRRERQRRRAQEQALRGRARGQQDRARGEQLAPLVSQKDLGQPDPRAAEVGDAGGRLFAPVASRKAARVDTAAVASLQKLGVKYNDHVDKKTFSVIATPLQDSQAQELGKYAVQILTLVRGVK